MESKLTLIENSQFKPKWEKKLFRIELLMGVSFVCFTILFCVHQSWLEWDETIDTSKWGTYGDFIGGLIGTVCAYISLRLLVKNLKEQEQEKANGCLRNSNDIMVELLFPQTRKYVVSNWLRNKTKSFFVDFFEYIFDFSNFSLLNTIEELDVTHDVKTEENGNKHTIWTMVKKNKSPLVIAMPQAINPQKQNVLCI